MYWIGCIGLDVLDWICWIGYVRLDMLDWMCWVDVVLGWICLVGCCVGLDVLSWDVYNVLG